MEVPKCPVCDREHESTLELEEGLCYWHYCEEAHCYIGWMLKGEPLRIPSNALHQMRTNHGL